MLPVLVRPAALLSHAIVLVVVATLVGLGQWQLSRLNERRTTNDRLEARTAAAPLDLAAVVAAGDADVDDLEFRRVTATGTYRTDDELLLEGREFRGQAGRDVLTPLELDDGSLVLVRRGWVPRAAGDPPVADAAPPSGRVTIDGFLERSVPEPGFGPRNPAEGDLTIAQVPDLDRIAPQLDGELFRMLVHLVDQDPPPVASGAVAARGLPPLPAIRGVQPFDEANHLSYAVQWHSFAVLATIAYVAWWVQRLRRPA